MTEPENSPKVIYLDTYTIVGHMHIPRNGQRRVELSKYLIEYPELHARVLGHELEHAKIGNVVKWQHMVFDIRDRFSWMSNPLIYEEWRAFMKRARTRMGVKDALMFCAFMWVSSIAQSIIMLIAGPLRAYRRYKTE